MLGPFETQAKLKPWPPKEMSLFCCLRGYASTDAHSRIR